VTVFSVLRESVGVAGARVLHSKFSHRQVRRFLTCVLECGGNLSDPHIGAPGLIQSSGQV